MRASPHLDEAGFRRYFSWLRLVPGASCAMASKVAKRLAKRVRFSALGCYAGVDEVRSALLGMLTAAGAVPATTTAADLRLAVYVKDEFVLDWRLTPETGLEVFHTDTFRARLVESALDDVSDGGSVAMPLFPDQVVRLVVSCGSRQWTFDSKLAKPPLKLRFQQALRAVSRGAGSGLR